MNERIQALAEQAGYEKDMFGIGHWDMPECKKLAELIVKECAEISEQSQWRKAKGEYYEGFNEAMIYVSNKIKEHFGVKE